MSQQNQPQINKDNIRKNKKRVYHSYKVGDKVMLDNHAAYKYGTPYKGLFVITQCWNNDMFALHCGAKTIRCNIHCIKPHTYDKNIEDIKC